MNLDLFALWSLVLSVVGYQIAAKVSRTTATAVVVGLWIVGIGLQVGLVILGFLSLGEREQTRRRT